MDFYNYILMMMWSLAKRCGEESTQEINCNCLYCN